LKMLTPPGPISRPTMMRAAPASSEPRSSDTMPAIIESVAAYATVEEICVAMRDVYGIYEEPAF